MGTRWIPLPCHTAQLGEILDVVWSDYYGAALRGERGELARLPHKGCRLEVLGIVESVPAAATGILPGQTIRYKGSFCFLDRFELPSGSVVGVWRLVGFKLRVLDERSSPVPDGHGDSTTSSERADAVWLSETQAGAADAGR